MKILMTSQHSSIIGGIERFLFDTSLILKKAGHNIFGLFEHDGIADANKKLFDRIWLSGESKGRDSLFAEIGETSPDIVVVHKLTDISLLQTLNRNFKTAAIVHDHEYYCIRKHKYFPIGRINCHLPFNLISCSLCSGMLARNSGKLSLINPFRHLRLLNEIRNCAKFAILSDYMRENLLQNGFEKDRIFKVRPPIHLSSSTPSENRRTGPLRILYVGQLVRGKGVDLLLAAAKHLKSEFTMKIAGSGNDEKYLKSMVSEIGLEACVSFSGRVSDIGPLYEWANLTVMPCRWQEPFGLVGVESMSRSRPVVAFDTGGISEWLKDGWNGLLAKPGDILQLAQGIDELASAEDKMRLMGANGMEMVRKKYSDVSFLESFTRMIEVES